MSININVIEREVITETVGARSPTPSGVGQVYMRGNAVETVVAASSTFYKMAGVTEQSPENRKYTSDGTTRLTCQASAPRKYLVQYTTSFSSGDNDVVEVGVYDSALGDVQQPSIVPATANTAGRAENVVAMCIVEHAEGDYLEPWVSNTSRIANITGIHLNMVVTEVG